MMTSSPASAAWRTLGNSRNKVLTLVFMWKICHIICQMSRMESRSFRLWPRFARGSLAGSQVKRTCGRGVRRWMTSRRARETPGRPRPWRSASPMRADVPLCLKSRLPVLEDPCRVPQVFRASPPRRRHASNASESWESKSRSAPTGKWSSRIQRESERWERRWPSRLRSPSHRGWFQKQSQVQAWCGKLAGIVTGCKDETEGFPSLVCWKIPVPLSVAPSLNEITLRHAGWFKILWTIGNRLSDLPAASK